MDHSLARCITLFNFEWLISGEWKQDRKKTLALQDALNDYGDYSIGDQDRISEEMAEELIRNGSIVLQGDIGYGTFYGGAKKVQLKNWKKSSI